MSAFWRMVLAVIGALFAGVSRLLEALAEGLGHVAYECDQAIAASKTAARRKARSKRESEQFMASVVRDIERIDDKEVK
jgi:hypothetical protein